MCGICGITWDDHELIKLMGNACKHRGPEQEGFYIDESISLCCERLRIIDLSDKASQPIHNEDQTIWVVLNGEIYNFRDLRESLEKKHDFYTDTDTEVIVHAYEEFGENCLQKLDGMFAFALWDMEKKKLFIARDRLGVKPLYYCIKSDKLLFASEIKSILQDPDIQRKLNYFQGVQTPASIRDFAIRPNAPCSVQAKPVSMRCCHASIIFSSSSHSKKPSAIPIASKLSTNHLQISKIMPRP